MFTFHQTPQTWQFHNQNNSELCLSNNPPSTSQTFLKISKPQTSTNNNGMARKHSALCRSDSSIQNNPSPAGRIKRLVLEQQGRTKLNNESDREFYAYPRFVKHVDENFISNLTNLYREILRPEMEILDLMSSWISHLPEEIRFKKMVGHGLNAQELARNPRLDYFIVKDLNNEQQLEFESGSFDAVLCTVSVQYLQQPEKVFAEIFRVLRPGGVFIVSFSNRLFYEKAVSAWREGTGYSRVQLVVQYFQCVDGYTEPQVIRRLQNAKNDDSLLSKVMGIFGVLSGSDPFYAVIAYKNFKPIYE